MQRLIYKHIFVYLYIQFSNRKGGSKMIYKIFVDGLEGTTGLNISDYLDNRDDIEILKIDSNERKDPNARKKLLNEADIAILCLPDVASKESVSLVENSNTRIIDASTAFRTDKNWVYGIPELNKNQRSLIKSAKRVSVPGCHATGFALSLNPLIQQGIVPTDYPVSFTSLTGYSGGGKNLIGIYENGELEGINSPKHYSLQLNHKHLPEMQYIAGLQYAPLFTPILGNYYKGMTTSLPLTTRLLNKKVSAKEVHEILETYYENEYFIKVLPFGDETYFEKGMLNTEGCINTNRLELIVVGNEDQVIVMARFDNLGKGASGAAIQNLNIMLGCEEHKGLIK